MKTIVNPGDPLRVQHNGTFYVIPNGPSSWPDDLAEHVQRKNVTVRGIRIQYAAPEPVVEDVIVTQPETPQPVDAEGNPIPVPVDGVHGEPAEAPVAPVEPSVEVQPEPPAAPIEGEAVAAEPPPSTEEQA